MAGETDNFGLILGWYDCMEQERTWFEIIKSYLKEQLRWIHSLLSRSTFNRVKFQAISSSPSNSESSEATYIWQRLTKYWKNDEEMALRSLVAFSSMSWIYWNLFLQRWISGENYLLDGICLMFGKTIQYHAKSLNCQRIFLLFFLLNFWFQWLWDSWVLLEYLVDRKMFFSSQLFTLHLKIMNVLMWYFKELLIVNIFIRGLLFIFVT